MPLIRVLLPYHLRNLAKVSGEVEIDVSESPTIASLLEALEAQYPVLKGAIRDHGSLKRRPFIRYFACLQDISHEPPETSLPADVVSGVEPFMIIGAMAGG